MKFKPYAVDQIEKAVGATMLYKYWIALNRLRNFHFLKESLMFVTTKGNSNVQVCTTHTTSQYLTKYVGKINENYKIHDDEYNFFLHLHEDKDQDPYDPKNFAQDFPALAAKLSMREHYFIFDGMANVALNNRHSRGESMEE